MKKMMILLVLFFLFPTISSLCEENQTDINSASPEELDEITYIGISRAEQMITLRPFSSVDDMIRIVGIGEIYLEDIKNQGLACVAGETQAGETQDEKDETEEPEEENNTESEEEYQELADKEETIKQPVIFDVIKLNPKDIKSENEVDDDKNKYAIYGFILFCILLFILFIIRSKKFNKNEFS